MHIFDVCAQPPAPSALCAFDEAGSEQWQRQHEKTSKQEASSFIHDSVHIYIYIFICMLCMHSHDWLVLFVALFVLLFGCCCCCCCWWNQFVCLSVPLNEMLSRLRGQNGYNKTC